VAERTGRSIRLWNTCTHKTPFTSQNLEIIKKKENPYTNDIRKTSYGRNCINYKSS
jgi:hypothetical protein